LATAAPTAVPTVVPTTEATSAPSATITPTPTPTETQTPDLIAQLYGLYGINTSYFAGNRQHIFFILLPEQTTLEVKEGSIIFDGSDTWVDVTGELTADGTFEAEGSGTVAGFDNVSVVFTGTLSVDGLNGLYTMGAAGELPGGESITYLVEGTKTN
jgi:hypothetical protein